MVFSALPVNDASFLSPGGRFFPGSSRLTGKVFHRLEPFKVERFFLNAKDPEVFLLRFIRQHQLQQYQNELLKNDIQ